MSERQDADAEFDEGRYLYCAVRADGDASLAVDGLEGGTVSVVARDEIGMVVQPVGSLFDSDDLAEVRRWLLSHQRVVDAAGEAFDTPVPFRFDTVIKGDDARVREWIEDRSAALTDALETVSGRWEYRIELRWDESGAREEIVADDDDLTALETRIEDASEGTAHLLEKQYEQRLEERLEERQTELAGRLYDRVGDHAATVETIDDRTTLLGAEGSEGEDGAFESVIRLSVLAEESAERAIGDVLESFAEQPEFEVRFTGPWPPYSHTPTIGGEDR